MTMRTWIKDVPSMIAAGRDLNYEQFMVAYDAPDCEESAAFVEKAKSWTPLGWWLYGWSCAARIVWTSFVCERKGHDLVDGGSSFGPDSGTECLACQRCGWSWSHTYY